MPFVEFKNVGGVGIVRDIPPHELPQDAWSGGRNVRFTDNKAEQILGHINWDSSICASAAYCMAVPQQNTTNDIWMYCGQTDVYAFTGSANYKLTASGVSATGQNTWTGTLLSGIAVLNYQQGKPLHWVFPPNTGTSLAVLPDWSASWTCKVIRSYKNYLVALGTTEGASTYPYRVRWSHAALPGNPPSSWNAADTTLDAGYTDLIEGGDQLIDGLPLADQFMLYKENSTWSMRYVGGNNIFSFQRVYEGIGLLSRNAVASLGRKHLVVGADDIYIHDGYSEPRSILTQKIRKYFYSDLARAHTDKIFTVPNHQNKEVWIFYPDSSTGRITKCLIWNYLYNTWSIRDCPPVTGGNFGSVEYADAQATWDGTAGTWDEQVGVWDENTYYREFRVVLAGNEDRKIYLADQSRTFDTAPVSSYLERRALPLGHDGQMKYCRGVYPRIKTPDFGYVNVYVGSHDKPTDTPVYSGPFRFYPRSEEKVDCRVTGKYLSIKFESGSSAGWQLDSYALDLDFVGRY